MPRLTPNPNFEELGELDLSSLCLYDIALLDQEPGPSSQPKPSTSQLLLSGQPSWTQQQPQQQQPPQPAGAQKVSQKDLGFHQIRRPKFKINCLNENPVMTNITLQPAVFVPSQNAGAVSWIDPQKITSGTILSGSVYQPCCICPQPLVVYQQPSLANLVVTAVGSSVAAPQEDPDSKEATAEEQQPQAEAQASDEDEGESKTLPVISPLCLDEETLKERAFEEYNAIMDSLEIEEKPKKDYLLEELFKVDEMFLEYLDELCSDRDFVRNVGSTLNMDYWDSLVSSDRVPVDLLAQETKQQEQKTRPNDCSAPLDEAPPNCPELPKCDQDSAPDGDVPLTDPNKEDLRKYEEELLNAIAAITTLAPDEEEEDEAQNNGDYYSTSPWETVDWSCLNIRGGQNALEFDPAAGVVICPFGSSPLLPSHVLELIQATPDHYMTTFSSPFDEAIYMNFTSPPQDPTLNSSTPLSSDLSAADLEALAEILLREDSKEEPSNLDWDTVQPKSGFSSPLPLSVLALQVFLNLDEPSQHGKDAGNEMTSHELILLEGVAVSTRDVFTFPSPVLIGDPWTGLESSFDDIPSSDVCRNLEPEMVEEALQNPQRQETETLVEERGKDASKSNTCVEKTVFPMRRSQRLSHKQQRVVSFEKTAKILHVGNGDSEVNAKKIDARKEIEARSQERRGRGEERKPKNVRAEHTVNVEKRRTRSMAAKADEKTRCGATMRWRSLGGSARENQNRDWTSSLREEKAVRDLLRRGRSQMWSPTKRCRQERWDFRRNDREMNRTHKCSPEKKLRESSANEGNCKGNRSKTERRNVKMLRNCICEARKMTANPPTTNNNRRSTRKRSRYVKPPAKYREFVTCQTKAAGPKRQRRRRRRRRRRAK